MKRSIALSVLLVLVLVLGYKSVSAEDGWQFVADDGYLSMYLQVGSLRPVTSNTFVVTTVMNYVADDGLYRSMLSATRVDCTARMSRNEVSTLYGLHFAKSGLPLGSVGVEEEWNAGSEKSLVRALINTVCDENKPVQKIR